MGLEVKGLTKVYDKFVAVNNITFDVPKNSIYGFLGANGAGKTTSFRMILGIFNRTSGEIYWDNKDIQKIDNKRIGYLPEERGLYPKISVKQQLSFFGKLRGLSSKQIKTASERWLEEFKVTDLLNKKVGQLSKGNQQKIQFISSVMHQPELLILDEPFSGLDPVNVEQLKKAVINLRDEGSTIIFSSHRMEHVEELCENIALLNKGNMIIQGNLSSIKKAQGELILQIQADFKIDEIKELPEVIDYQRTAVESIIRVKGEKEANIVQQWLFKRGYVRKFLIKEPSLNDIFVKKVGLTYE
ncbi:ABC transporter ATP-binding protein [Bacillus velezensis]|uniref:ABC transporter ATP-binding protein n=1 Tax=Bacillus TaxID=1386 RepID=UPI000C197D7B|nr:MULTISPECIES: ATP-binding cassette domain-containing protein [Bacillus]ATU28671.1 sodium ABC transporter ATP-binding protein [Bacillus velezensis]ATY30251.1 sodium ABC transporter ATP-binding protein [Bacillus velezensis]KAF1277126.1 sodium ABC transporter ATP-binding protein [Bacillus amyloliquefaciens]MBI0441400.1 ATP-binding cassette domain-containing protein [Bacillus velezensis]MCA1230976.1 ATP-binding cassette domain-containing protein [Bacillus velezensis]